MTHRIKYFIIIMKGVKTMKMKKYLALVAACAMTAGLLAGCGSSASSASTAEESSVESSVEESSVEESSVEESSTQESSTEESTTDGSVDGGWTVSADDTAVTLPDEVKKAFDTAYANYMGVTLVPYAYLGSQVVSGTNYKILCKATPVGSDTTSHLVVATVYADLDGKAEFTSVNDFNIEDYAKDIEVDAQTGLAGGWTVAEEGAMELPSGLSEAFTQATAKLTGASYEPIAALAYQVVSGQNTAVLCREKASTSDGQTKLSLVIIYTPTSGDSEVKSVANLNLADL